MNIITIPRRLIKNKYWRPFLPSSKKILDLVPEKLSIFILICWTTDQRKEYILPLSQLSSSSPNISILTRGETKSTWPKIFGLSRCHRLLLIKEAREQKVFISAAAAAMRGDPLGLAYKWADNIAVCQIYPKMRNHNTFGFWSPSFWEYRGKLGQNSPDPDIFFKLQNGSNATLKLIWFFSSTDTKRHIVDI